MQYKTTFKDKILKNIWYLVALILFVLFILFTPIQYCDSFWYSLIRGLICGVFVLLGVLQCDIREIMYYEFENSDARNKVLFVSIGAFIACVLIFYATSTARVHNELKEHGVFAEATITEGRQTITKSKRGTSTSYTIVISFRSEDGKEHRFGVNVSGDKYSSLSQGDKLSIVYLRDHSSIYKLLLEDIDIKNFLNISNRDITYDDLEKMMDMESSKLEDYLSSISLGWETDVESDGVSFRITFENPLKKEAITLGKDRLVYLGPCLGGSTMSNSFFNGKVLDHYQSTDPEMNGTWYELEGGFKALLGITPIGKDFTVKRYLMVMRDEEETIEEQ